MTISFNTSKIDEMLELEANNLKLKKRQFSIFGYHTIFKDKKLSELKTSKISKERALFPTMNPNLFCGLPSIFSCKSELRVCLNPGDVIFCFPNKSNMKDYFIKFKKEPAPERCLTLVLIVIKKCDLIHSYSHLPFKACNISRNIIKNDNYAYKTFAGDLIQTGDITAKYEGGQWKPVGGKNNPHYHNTDDIFSLNYKLCKYRKYLSELNENTRPFPNKGCNKLKCDYYGKECNMELGNWKYDILFKWGLLGSLNKHIPIEFRSFYLGSKGWSLKVFEKEIKSPRILDNIRYYNSKVLNERGQRILDKLRKEFNIK